MILAEVTVFPTDLFSQLTGPYGVIVVMGIVIFFMWKLFREAVIEGKARDKQVSELTQAVRDLTTELKVKREAS